MKMPQNIEIEQQILGEIIGRGDAIQSVIEILKAEDFYRASHQIIYQTMLDCYDKDIFINLSTLYNELNEKGKLNEVGGATYMTSLLSCACEWEHSTLYNAGKVIESKKKRGLVVSMIEITKDLDMSWENIQKSIGDKLLNQVMENKGKNTFFSINERGEEILSQIRFYYENKGKNIGIATGFPKLMRKCPFLLKDYVILAGAPRLGKSILAMNLVYNIARAEKRHTAFLSCEMSREEIELRLNSLHSGYNTGDIMFGKVHPENLKIDSLKELPILISEFGSTTVEKIRNGLRLLKKKYSDLCFVAIDAINFIKDSSNNKNGRAQEITEISGKLRDLAQTLNIIILLVCQLPKTISGKKPKLEDIKDSGSLGYDADTVFFLHWDIDKYLKEPDTDIIKVELLIEKQRRGIWGRSDYLTFIPTKMYFGESDGH